MRQLLHPSADEAVLDFAEFENALQTEQPLVPIFRRKIKEIDDFLQRRFEAGDPASELVPLRANLIDLVLGCAWRTCFPKTPEDIALVAVGGYGRGELHPGSDVDIMILLRNDDHERYGTRLERLLTFLWDIGLEVGHSVRSLSECEVEAARDITVATNIMESRRLAGTDDLYREMRRRTGPERVWPSKEFFEAKWAEQQARHERFHDTAYNLEPNIKESPGGLRDIHMVGWVAKRHFGAATLHDLVTHEFLTEAEYGALKAGQDFLWDVRFALHCLARRREDRLLFDYQMTLAKQFGYEDRENALGVEQFMQRYYRAVMELSRLNEMLLQLFQEAILYADDTEPPLLINKRFQARKGFLEITHPNVFKRYPFALLEAFLLMEQHPELKGVRASTIRLIRRYRELIDEHFRKDLRCRSLFMEILRQPQGITHELRRMHRYGVLGKYLPAFGNITGRMQYDLFHVYTVDSHTLFVVRALRRFAIPKHAHELPLCSSIMTRLPKQELLYLAALFHDIAKGRGGDHSTLGAADARDFCELHGLSPYDTRLVSWLVQHHLLMSITAQRKDINDPQVINEFARQVADQTHLDYLYLLTVADIRSTNPSLWNSWKDSLLLELYTLTKRALRRGLENAIDKDELIRETQRQAERRLKVKGLHHMTARAIWRRFGDDYFLRHNPEEIAWHTEAIVRLRSDELPLVLINPEGFRGGTDIFVYANDEDHFFALTVATLDQLGLDIQDARIITTEGGHTLDSYLVLDKEGEAITDPFRVQEIVNRLRKVLKHTECLPSPTPPPGLPRRLRHFSTPTQISFSEDRANDRTVMELITGDRPGLLARVGYAFTHCGVRLNTAKIATFGERAEDMFFIADRENRPISDPALFECLRQTLFELLEAGAAGEQQPASN